MKSTPRPLPVRPPARSPETIAPITAPAAVKTSRAARARNSAIRTTAGNVDRSVDGHVACGQQIDRRVEGVAIKPQRGPAGDGDRGAVEDAICWQVECRVVGNVQRPIGPGAAGVEVGLGKCGACTESTYCGD